MRFMMMVKADEQGAPPPALMEAMGKLIERETRAGRLIDTGGLLPKPMGFEVRLHGGKVKVVDGPFAEAKEVIGGYAIFELAGREEAEASAIEFMTLHKDFAPGWEGICEVRAMAPTGG
ncbi:YciI family protein [Bosea sp. BIWAKO-01]|uniref:YciI family protein n=1 Tax=Bosea sp. BIWAKO-01 TaxID=506668 RepID=UPI000853946C|nr:YciI family protein [Bosea sp. BIWAKO-01]GAU84836.1 PhnB protein [Bosea sp. BIWAKO-01]